MSSGEVRGRNAGALGFAAAAMKTLVTYILVQRKERPGGGKTGGGKKKGGGRGEKETNMERNKKFN